MTSSSKNASAKMIPPHSACCEGPRIAERRGDTVSIAVNWEGRSEAEKIAKNINEVARRAIRDAAPWITPDSIDVHLAGAVSDEELKGFCDATQSAAGDLIATLSASGDAGPVAGPSVPASKGTDCVTAQNDAEVDGGDEDADAGDVIVIDVDVADISQIKNTDGDDSVELNRAGSNCLFSPSRALDSRSDRGSSINEDDKLEENVSNGSASGEDAEIRTITLRSGKELHAPPVWEVKDDDYRALGMMPCFEIEALSEEGIVDRCDDDGWFPVEVPLEWTRSWAWRN